MIDKCELTEIICPRCKSHTGRYKENCFESFIGKDILCPVCGRVLIDIDGEPGG